MPNQDSFAIENQKKTQSFPSLGRSVLVGGIGFTIASLVVFGTVAFAGRWMYQNLGVAGAYLIWILLFILLAGGLLGFLVTGPWRLPRFYFLFGLVFLGYSAGWIGAYFTVTGTTGEWLGSLAGSVLLASILALGFKATRTILSLSVLLFVTNSVGYFLGSALNNTLGGRAGMLLWGLAYGLCLGSGLGATLHIVQARSATTMLSTREQQT